MICYVVFIMETCFEHLNSKTMQYMYKIVDCHIEPIALGDNSYHCNEYQSRMRKNILDTGD